jgi:hypothetical protein
MPVTIDARTAYGMARVARIRAMWITDDVYVSKCEAENEYYIALNNWAKALKIAPETAEELHKELNRKSRARFDAEARERERHSDVYPLMLLQLERSAAEDYLGAAIRDSALQVKGDRALDDAVEAIYGYWPGGPDYNDQYSKDRNWNFGQPKVW